MDGRLELLHDAFQRVAAMTQCRPEFVMIGFGDLVQQVFVLFLQELQEKFFFLVGQPQFHGDLHLTGEYKTILRRQLSVVGCQLSVVRNSNARAGPMMGTPGYRALEVGRALLIGKRELGNESVLLTRHVWEHLGRIL